MWTSVTIALLIAQVAAGPASGPSSLSQNPAQANSADPNAKSPEKCSVAGKAVNAVTGEPLKKTHITLQGTTPDNAGTGTSVITGPDGTFLLKDVEPGTYRLNANRTGFAPTSYGARKLATGGTDLKLNAGQAMQDVVL